MWVSPPPTSQTKRSITTYHHMSPQNWAKISPSPIFQKGEPTKKTTTTHRSNKNLPHFGVKPGKSQFSNDQNSKGKHQSFTTSPTLSKYLSSWWFQPIWKILYSQIGSFPQVGMKIKNVWNHQLVLRMCEWTPTHTSPEAFKAFSASFHSHRNSPGMTGGFWMTSLTVISSGPTCTRNGSNTYHHTFSDANDLSNNAWVYTFWIIPSINWIENSLLCQLISCENKDHEH